ncbi:MAG: trimethylamine methyltransferase family protein, partial [Gammaproteobacteria bacterium]|nr:trimethylamine methyltransferase family protein [Gammaproteobacteria bacterium]
MPKRTGRARRGPRASPARRPPGGALNQLPARPLRNPFPPVEVLSAEAVERIHDGSMRILEQIGLQIVNDRARALMVEHGATVDPDTGYVRIDREMLMEKIAT